MKTLFNTKKVLSKTQKELMKEHKVNHTKKHMDMMKKLLLEGYCFQQAHQLSMRKVGK